MWNANIMSIYMPISANNEMWNAKLWDKKVNLFNILKLGKNVGEVRLFIIQQIGTPLYSLQDGLLFKKSLTLTCTMFDFCFQNATIKFQSDNWSDWRRHIASYSSCYVSPCHPLQRANKPHFHFVPQYGPVVSLEIARITNVTSNIKYL